jgi:hypothetical protein
MGKGWVLDTVAFLAYSRREPDTLPVFAFHSERAGEWTNTLQLDSTPPLIGAGQWISDGISFYTYPSSRNQTALQPVWRYWNVLTRDLSMRHQRFTQLLINRNDLEYQREGWIRDQIVFYALPYEI